MGMLRKNKLHIDVTGLLPAALVATCSRTEIPQALHCQIFLDSFKLF